MGYQFVPKATVTSRVGRVAGVFSRVRHGDLMILTEVRDHLGNTYPDCLVGRRDLYPLPDKTYAAFQHSMRAVDLLPSGEPDLASLENYVFVRKQDGFEGTSGWAFHHGWVSEVLEVGSSTVEGMPSAGELIVHYEPHTYWVDENYAFVRVAADLSSTPDYGFVARAVIT